MGNERKISTDIKNVKNMETRKKNLMKDALRNVKSKYLKKNG